MKTRALILAALLFGISAAPSEASCVASLQWRGSDYILWSTAAAVPGPVLAEPATIPICHDVVTIYLGETKPRPEPYVPPRREIVSTIVGVPPRVAVLRDGEVYRNLEPLEALPWVPWPRA